MQFAYLGADAIFACVWLWLFCQRPDLRKLQLAMSLCMLPLALSDFFFVPTYWRPVILGNIPVGIEGFIFSFSVGGIASVLYLVLRKRKPARLPHNRRLTLAQTIFVPALMPVIFFAAYFLGAPDPMVAAYLAFAVCIVALVRTRPDLTSAVLWSGLLFGACYFVCLRLWVSFFPGVHDWFIFQGLPKVFVWSVPGWESLFGFFYGALWSALYEFVFGYKFVPLKSRR